VTERYENPPGNLAEPLPPTNFINKDEYCNGEGPKFMARFERCEPAIIDSSAAQTFKRCHRQYFYRYVLGWKTKKEPEFFRFGRAYHKFREILERTQDFKTALIEAQTLFRKGGGDPVVGSKYDFLTELRLLKSCSVAHEHWKKEKFLKVIEVIAIEQPFNVELSDGSRTSGRADQIVKWNGKLWGRDFKTTSKMGKYYERSLEPNDQFTRYTFAEGKLCGESLNGQIVEALYNTKKEGPSIHQFLATRTPTQVAVWESEQRFYNMVLNTCRATDTWPMNENACWLCDYHSVCKTPTENMQMNRLENDYVYSPWDNMKVDQDEVAE
jgi:hypothetical protein